MAEHFSNRGPICPYCEHEHHADEASFFDEDLCAFDCAACDKTFPLVVNNRWTWTSRKVGEVW